MDTVRTVLPLTRSQIERLGVRLVKEMPEPDKADLALLRELQVAYRAILDETVARVTEQLGVRPSARIKNRGTVLEKLERHGGSWLKSIQDIAGMRIVAPVGRDGQDELVRRLVALFAEEQRQPKVIDRRTTPSHGYRAVHVIAFVQGAAVEIQVRTRWQHEWAEVFEKLADKVGRGIRYGEPPENRPPGWLVDRPPEKRDEVLRAQLQWRTSIVSIALLVSNVIDAYEAADADEPSRDEMRRLIERELAELRLDLERL